MSENFKGTCFVVMGFGVKTDFQSDPKRQLDLDKTYNYIIKPAVEEAGLKCLRADEIVHSGQIDVPMYEQLLKADLVVADLSTANSNAFYELGVRHALRPYTTIIIAEDQFKFPFDLGHIVIRKYKHLGTGIDFEEVMRFRAELKKAVTEILTKRPPESDSPVYTFLRKLRPPALGDEAAAAEAGREMDAALGGRRAPSAGDEDAPPGAAVETHSAMMERIEDAQKRGDFETAKTMLAALRLMRPGDTYVVHRLVVATFKSGKPTPRQALEEARELLKTLSPEVSDDPWTLGLWGTVHERLWKATGDRAHLDEALRGYERSFNLRHDYFNGIHEAFLLNVRASISESPAEAVADFVLAQRIRREVIPVCEEWLRATKAPEESSELSEGDARLQRRALDDHLEEKSWVLATLAEAHLGTGDGEKARRYFEEAEAVIRQLGERGYPAFKIEKMRASTRQKREELEGMLAASPLRFLKADGS
jgi:hypothetical protein